MPEIIFNGPEGRLEGRYHAGVGDDAPIAIILHPHPQYSVALLCYALISAVLATHKVSLMMALVS